MKMIFSIIQGYLLSSQSIELLIVNNQTVLWFSILNTAKEL